MRQRERGGGAWRKIPIFCFGSALSSNFTAGEDSNGTVGMEARPSDVAFQNRLCLTAGICGAVKVCKQAAFLFVDSLSEAKSLPEWNQRERRVLHLSYRLRCILGEVKSALPG